MKDSTGDFERHRAYLEAVPEGFDVYTGTEPLIRDSVAAGAAGSINGLANCVPELMTALREGDDAAHEELVRLKAEVKAAASSVAAIKRRVRARLAERGVDYPAATRAPFG